jgi:hypothetical protein
MQTFTFCLLCMETFFNLRVATLIDDEGSLVNINHLLAETIFCGWKCLPSVSAAVEVRPIKDTCVGFDEKV